MKTLVLALVVLASVALLASGYPYEDRQYLGGHGVLLSYDNRGYGGYGAGYGRESDGYGGGYGRGYGGYGGDYGRGYDHNDRGYGGYGGYDKY